MTLVDHLTELRSRIIKSIAAVALGGTVVFLLYHRLLDVMIQPYCDTLPAGEECKLFITSPLEGFAARINVATYGGILLGSPVVLWQIWRFVTPGLEQREKRYAVPFVLSSVLLFVGGTALGFVTFPKALEFLIGIAGSDVETIFSPARYLSFLLKVLLAFGLVFEFPVLLVFLQLVGVLSPATLRRQRRMAIVVMTVVAAVVTPSQDPYTMLAMAIPMCLFYEISILIGWFMTRSGARSRS
ncbi:MAG TPA: twin-arginine translocase subunit TatC [Acidimicrobiales bacterium]|nr:twin-arginine translocase subunit TatC [Acidimicrobiales bacterium]